MTDKELIDYLRDSPDLDDHSIVVREDILHYLKSKPGAVADGAEVDRNAGKGTRA